jgi:S1-C subfamily serine protease
VEEDQGILVVQVGQGSPAAKAGLRPGDVIEEIDNQPVTGAKTIQQFIDKAGVGGELQVKLQRNGKTVALKIEPEQLPTIPTR